MATETQPAIGIANMHAVMTRRQFLAVAGHFGGWASTVLLRVLPAQAIEPFTAVSIGLSIVNSLAALNAMGGGIGEQFAALNVKLDQILKNQVYTLEAIQQLQSSIDRLERQLGGFFTEERYRDLAISVLNLQADTNRVLEPITHFRLALN
jgi:hypothetical protein